MSEEHDDKKAYLGDGVYATFDGFQIWLTTTRGNVVDSIALEPAVWTALVKYVAKLKES